MDTNYTDINGKSIIHYVVSPFSYGSYENVVILNKLSEHFSLIIEDKNGKSPLYYATK